MSDFLHNAWYVAALSSEVERSLTPVRLLSQAIVLYRTQDGQPVALEDACAHRKLPLSMGRLKGDAAVHYLDRIVETPSVIVGLAQVMMVITAAFVVCACLIWFLPKSLRSIDITRMGH